MTEEKLPIKFFAKREIDEQKIEGGGSTEIPKWVLKGEELKEHAFKLYSEFELFSKKIITRIETGSPVPAVFTAKINNDATAKSRRQHISSLLQTNLDNGIIGFSSSENLMVKVDSVAQLNEISKRLKINYNQHNYAISCLESFSEFVPIIQKEENDMTYKIKLIDFQDYGMNIAMMRLFEQRLSNRNISFSKTEYANQFPIYKIKKSLNGILDSLRDDDSFNILFSIEPMPRYTISLDLFDTAEEEFYIEPIEGQKYETLGILDSGISPIKQFSKWLVGKSSVYPDKFIDSMHGTFVAGVALYGDIVEHQDWIGHKGIKLFDATVFPDLNKEGVDEDDLIANISEVIKQNSEKIKIWNLSISIERPISDSKFSDFAIALDDIQDRYNVLICKSAGNCRNFVSGMPTGRINEGADSVRSLVVGSVAHTKPSSDFVETDNPSPFSRIGPGPEFIIKPEVSHYGGNAGVNSVGKLVTAGVKSFSKDGYISTSVGTSFSTPRIASMATGLYQELAETFDSLLLKGLIIHSATYSDKLLLPEFERTKRMGFGIPSNISQILYNAPYEATLILRDTLSKGECIDIMDFPMPKSLIKDGFYTGQIIATLVYNPILDKTQGIEYCQSNIDIKFGSYDEKILRDTTKPNILNPVGREGAQNLFRGDFYSKTVMKSSRDDFALRERLLIQYADKYYPVKKYAVDLSELTDASKQKFATPEKKWYLYLRGLFRDFTVQRAEIEHFVPCQDFCLILTVRDPLHKANIYDEVTQGLDEYNFWHKNIKLSSDVRLTV